MFFPEVNRRGVEGLAGYVEHTKAWPVFGGLCGSPLRGLIMTEMRCNKRLARYAESLSDAPLAPSLSLSIARLPLSSSFLSLFPLSFLVPFFSVLFSLAALILFSSLSLPPFISLSLSHTHPSLCAQSNPPPPTHRHSDSHPYISY